VLALTVLPGVVHQPDRILAVRGVPKLAAPDAQYRCAREISMERSRWPAVRLRVAWAREDSHALRVAADSNLVWGQPCLLQQAAQMQAGMWPLAASSRQAHATPPALAVAPKSLGASWRVSWQQLMGPILVLQAPHAEPAPA
jgi:hypothetical protein